MAVFRKNGLSVMVEMDSHESYEMFAKRGWFIVCQKPETLDEYNEAVRFSRIYVGVKDHGRIYSDSIMIKLDKKCEKLAMI